MCCSEFGNGCTCEVCNETLADLAGFSGDDLAEAERQNAFAPLNAFLAKLDAELAPVQTPEGWDRVEG